MLDLKVEQGLRKIKFMRKLFFHKRHKTLIQSTIEWYQLTTGVEEPLLAKSKKKLYKKRLVPGYHRLPAQTQHHNLHQRISQHHKPKTE